MYIEVFLLDNFLMDMLILKLASAMSGLKYSVKCACFVCIFQSVYSAFAVRYEFLCGLVFKLLLCIISALPFYRENPKSLLIPIVCVFISTLLAGGLALAFSLTNGTRIVSGSWLRLFLYPAFVLTFFPALVRKLKMRKAKGEFKTVLYLRHGEKRFSFDAIIDSGSSLRETISGMPVILLYAPELKKYAHTPVSFTDTAGIEHLALAFTADTALVENKSIEVMIAPLDTNPKMPAIIPYFAVYGNDF